MVLSVYERWFKYIREVIGDLERRIEAAIRGHNRTEMSQLLHEINECHNAFNENAQILRRFKFYRVKYKGEDNIFKKHFKKKIQGANEKWKLDNPNVLDILDLRKKGKSLGEIALKKKMSKSQVQKIIEKFKIPKGKTHIIPEDD